MDCAMRDQPASTARVWERAVRALRWTWVVPVVLSA